MLNNCKQCGKLYVADRKAYCEECFRLQEDMYRKVREFVRSHPNSTLMDVHQQTGVPLPKLLEMQKESYIFHGNR